MVAISATVLSLPLHKTSHDKLFEVVARGLPFRPIRGPCLLYYLAPVILISFYLLLLRFPTLAAVAGRDDNLALVNSGGATANTGSPADYSLVKEYYTLSYNRD